MAQKAVEAGELTKADALLADAETEQRRGLSAPRSLRVQTVMSPWVPEARTTSGASATNSFCELCRHCCEPTIVNAHVAADSPAEFGEPLRKRPDAGRCLRIVCGHAHQRTDPPHSLAPLRPQRERPHGRRAAEQGGELASF